MEFDSIVASYQRRFPIWRLLDTMPRFPIFHRMESKPNGWHDTWPTNYHWTRRGQYLHKKWAKRLPHEKSGRDRGCPIRPPEVWMSFFIKRTIMIYYYEIWERIHFERATPCQNISCPTSRRTTMGSWEALQVLLRRLEQYSKTTTEILEICTQ